MYKCRYFSIQELVPRHVFEQRGDRAWQLLDERLLITADALRSDLGPMYVNNWHRGGNSQWRGLRTADSPYYRPYSQHSFGRALDATFRSVTPEEARQHIRDNIKRFPWLTAIELDVNWLHFDVRNVERLMEFSP